jgi:hypothetical protein
VRPGLIACTVASPAYHGQARAMATSFLEHHPDSRVTIADLGRAGHGAERALDPANLDERIELLDPRELFEDPAELDQLGLAYSTQGLAGALKPRLIRRLLAEGGGEAVALIDSDIFIYGPLGDLAERAARECALLTPHLITPHVEAERPTLVAGTFNSGFLLVGAGGAEMIDWWCERTARECIFRPSAGMVWEQSWLGLAPAFFPLSVLRDAGVNAMTRELLEEDVEWRDEVPYLSGRRLRAMHFSGPYDPTEPGFLLSQAESGEAVVTRSGPLPGSEFAWLSLEEKPGAARLSADYAQRLLEADGLASRDARPPYEVRPDGGALNPAMRSAYREGLIEAEREGCELPPNIFEGAEIEEFLDWLAEPPPGAEPDGRLNRFLLGAWRAHLAETAFPDVPGKDTSAFLAWLDARLGDQPTGIAKRLLAREPRRPGGGGRRLRPRGWRR